MLTPLDAEARRELAQKSFMVAAAEVCSDTMHSRQPRTMQYTCDATPARPSHLNAPRRVNVAMS